MIDELLGQLSGEVVLGGLGRRWRWPGMGFVVSFLAIFVSRIVLGTPSSTEDRAALLAVHRRRQVGVGGGSSRISGPDRAQGVRRPGLVGNVSTVRLPA